jgi:hypothetical protein
VSKNLSDFASFIDNNIEKTAAPKTSCIIFSDEEKTELKMSAQARYL